MMTNSTFSWWPTQLFHDDHPNFFHDGQLNFFMMVHGSLVMSANPTFSWCQCLIGHDDHPILFHDDPPNVSWQSMFPWSWWTSHFLW
jgi:hypothetical protein